LSKTKLLEDPEGTHLPDVEAAKQEAILAARDILSNAIRAGKEKVPEAFVIVDDAGQAVATIPLVVVLPKALKS
jgi:hypothetical protein